MSEAVVRRHNLGRWSRRTLRALGEVVLPADPSIDLDAAVDFADDWVRYMPRLFQLLFPIGLLMLELGAFVLAPSLLPFSLMSLPRRRRYIAAWAHSRSPLRRDLIKGVKGLFVFQYYSQPQVAAQLGYHVDEHVAFVKSDRLKRHGHAI